MKWHCGDPEVASFGKGGWAASIEDMRLFYELLQERFSGVRNYLHHDIKYSALQIGELCDIMQTNERGERRCRKSITSRAENWTYAKS